MTQLGVTRQHVHQPGGESAAVRGALQPAQPVAKPTVQSAATPQQQVVAQQSPSRNKILGSETLYSIVVVLTRLLKDEALKNQVCTHRGTQYYYDCSVNLIFRLCSQCFYVRRLNLCSGMLQHALIFQTKMQHLLLLSTACVRL